MEAKRTYEAVGSHGRGPWRAIQTLGIGTGYLTILLALAFAPFLWDAYPRDVPDSTLLLVGLTLVTAVGMLTSFTMRLLARSRYRFRLRTLLAGLVILCLFLAIVSNQLHFRFRCWEAQRHLAQAGGYRVEVDFSFERSRYREWVEFLGLDVFARVTMLSLPTDRAVEVFAQHPDEFAGVHTVEFGPVTDLGLARLANSAQLRNLRRITFRESLTTDDGLRCLGECSNLKLVLIHDCARLTDACLQHVGTIPGLIGLALSGNYSDAGFAHLQNAVCLEVLEIDSPAITDIGLKHLCHLAGLKGLRVSGPCITAEGIDELRTALPECLINDALQLPLSFLW
jgi:hypothetical protein